MFTDCTFPKYVMARFMRAIHVFAEPTKKDVDDPDKPGHDELCLI